MARLLAIILLENGRLIWMAVGPPDSVHRNLHNDHFATSLGNDRYLDGQVWVGRVHLLSGQDII